MITLSPDTQYQPRPVAQDAVPAIQHGAMIDNERQMQEIDQRQQETGELIGRFVHLDEGPTTCTYQITALTHTTATINHCAGLPDNRPHPAIGPWATLDRQHIQAIITQQDRAAAAEAEAKANGWW